MSGGGCGAAGSAVLLGLALGLLLGLVLGLPLGPALGPGLGLWAPDTSGGLA